jgi:hypothetical protein
MHLAALSRSCWRGGIRRPAPRAVSPVLGVAQDAALRDKRRALGRALASGIEGDDARIDDELLFIRAVADVDVPYIKLLRVLSQDQPSPGQLSGSVFHGGWSLATVAARHPEFGGALPALIWTLESHALIQTVRSATPTTAVSYTVTSAGRQLLDRLADDPGWRPGRTGAVPLSRPACGP